MNKKTSRIDIIGQNGNEGIHYGFDLAKEEDRSEVMIFVPYSLILESHNKCVEEEHRAKLAKYL